MSVSLIPQEINKDIVFDLIGLRVTSGQKSWVTTLKRRQIVLREILNELARSFNTTVVNEFMSTISFIINHFYPLIPVDTGALRASFVSNFFIVVKSTQISSEFSSVALSMEFNLDKWMQEIPYARYHIEEIVGKSEYKTVKGKRPLDLQFFADIIDGLKVRLEKAFIANGWFLEIRQIHVLEKGIGDAIRAAVTKWGVTL